VTPSILSQQHVCPSLPPSSPLTSSQTLVTWNYLSNYSKSLTAEIDLSPTDPTSPTSLAERVPLGGMTFSWRSLQARAPLSPPPFMFLDSKFSSAALMRRVVLAIIQATGTERHLHHPQSLMTRAQGEAQSSGGGGGKRLRREDRDGGRVFGNSLLVSLLGRRRAR
jgi:hypothetical protein